MARPTLKHMQISSNEFIILIPAFNEQDAIVPLIAGIRAEWPEVLICFIDDHSTDNTKEVLSEADCAYLRLPCNLGVGGAMQAGFRYALEQGYAYAIRLDGDGQHPSAECVKLIERMAVGDVDMVVGSRFLGQRTYTSTLLRQMGIFALAKILSLICRRRITDPTSGFQMVNRAVMHYFAAQYPGDYPEPESLALLSRQGYRVCEVATTFRPRVTGRSSIRRWGAFFYVFKVGVALFVDRCRAVDPRFARRQVEELL